MPWGGLGPLLFPFWVSVTWSLNACFTHPKPHKNQLDSNSGRKGRAGNTDFLILSFWGSSFTLPSTIARQANWFVTSRDTRRSWQLTWNIIERGLCYGTTWGQGRTTSWGCHWCRWVWCGSHGDGTAAGGTVMGWPKLMVFKAVGFFSLILSCAGKNEISAFSWFVWECGWLSSKWLHLSTSGVQEPEQVDGNGIWT